MQAQINGNTKKYASTPSIMLVVLTFIWGSTFPVSKISFAGFSPLLSTGLRFVMAGCLFFLLSIHRLHKLRRTDVFQASMLGLLIALTICLQNLGLAKSSPTRVAFLSYLYVIFIPPLQLLFTKKHIHFRSIIGLVTAIAGLFIFSLPVNTGMNSSDIMIVLSCLTFAAYFICIDRFERKHNILSFNMLQFLFAAPLCFIFALQFEEMYITPAFPQILSLFYLAVIATGVGILIHVHFQHHVTPIRAAIIFILEPIFAALITIALFGTLPTWYEISGGCVILAGVLISELRRTN